MVKIKPKALVPGDKIRFVSPASPVMSEHLSPAQELLEQAGFQVEFGKHVFDHVDYLAGTDQDRAADIMDAFLDPSVSAVFCSRGGYGCPRLMPLLDLSTIAKSAKVFLGFSDITTLHVALNRRGLVTLYSPMGSSLRTPRADWVLRSLLNGLTGHNPLDVPYPKGTCVVPGTAEGDTTGGCLVPFMDSLSTPDEIDMDGKILLIEDVGERAHRVDALLTHLIRTGKIQKCAGIVMGEMTGTDELCKETTDGKPSEMYQNVTWRAIVRERLEPLGIPLIIDFPFGHIENMLTIPLGVRARIDANQGTLELVESHCT